MGTGYKNSKHYFPIIYESKLQIPNLLSLILTVSWVGAITNSINWIDGLDGLAIGVSAITLSQLQFLIFKMEISK